MNHLLISKAKTFRSSVAMRLTSFVFALTLCCSPISLFSYSSAANVAEETKKDETKKDEEKAAEAAKEGIVGHAEKPADAHAADSKGHGSAGGDHHEDMDLTHANAAADMEVPNALRADKTLFSLVVFGLLLAGLYLLAWKPIMEGLGKREADINGLIAKTQKASEDAADKLRQYELQLQTAAQEAQNVIAQARRDGEASAQRIISEAQNEALRRKDQAIAEIDSAKRAAIADLSTKSTDLAFSLAKRIVGRELRKEDHQQLIQDVLNQLPSRN